MQCCLHCSGQARHWHKEKNGWQEAGLLHTWQSGVGDFDLIHPAYEVTNQTWYRHQYGHLPAGTETRWTRFDQHERTSLGRCSSWTAKGQEQPAAVPLRCMRLRAARGRGESGESLCLKHNACKLGWNGACETYGGARCCNCRTCCPSHVNLVYGSELETHQGCLERCRC